MENNTMMLNGQKYRLIPVKAEWEIRFVHRTGQPNCLLGHNGRYLPYDCQIFVVRLGEEDFTVGDKICEGIIEKFIYDDFCNYVFAKIKDEEKYVDVDLLKKFVEVPPPLPRLLKEDEEPLPPPEKSENICKCCGKKMKTRTEPEYICMNPYCDNYIKIIK